jgi:MOB kinase activator 1
MQTIENSKSFRPRRDIEKNSRLDKVRTIAKMTLGSGNLLHAVELPVGEDLNEWLAVHTIEFYNEVNLMYGVLCEFCTPASCPMMSAGPKYEYLWADGSNSAPRAVSAYEYIDLLMNWVDFQLNDEAMFPTALGVSFPRNFISVIKVIFKRLFRVYAHIYHSHFAQVMSVNMEYHLNTCFKHFIFFLDRYRLVDDKDLHPLAELIQQFKERAHEAEVDGN